MTTPERRGEGEESRESEANPEDSGTTDYARAPARSPNPWLIGTDLTQARKRILWGGGAGLAAAIINFIVVMSTYFVGDTAVEGVVRPSGGQFLFVLVEAGLYTLLAAGVLRRNRKAAFALLGYHVVSKALLFGLAAAGLGPGNLHPVSVALNLVFAYLFFQGLRGVLTWQFLTHPLYPTAPPADTGDSC